MRKIKKLLCIFVCMAMALTAVPAAFAAETGADAEIPMGGGVNSSSYSETSATYETTVATDETTTEDTTTYTNVSTEAELRSAIEKGGAIKLTADIALTTVLTISADTTVEIDLNNCTLSQNNTKDEGEGINAINNYGTLTVSGGKIYSNRNGIYNGVSDETVATLTVSGCTIEGTNYGIYNDGTATVTDCTISGTYFNGIYNTGTLTVNSGTFSGPDGSLYSDGGNTVTINGGTFENGVYNSARIGYDEYDEPTGEKIPAGALIVNDGTIKVKVYNEGSLTINGGTFTSDDNDENCIEHYGTSLAINGGTFSGNLYNSTGGLTIGVNVTTINFPTVKTCEVLPEKITYTTLGLVGTVTSGTFNNVSECGAIAEFPEDSTAVVNLNNAIFSGKINGGTFKGTVNCADLTNVKGGKFSEELKNSIEALTLISGYTPKDGCRIDFAKGYGFVDNMDGTFTVQNIGTVTFDIKTADNNGYLSLISYETGTSKGTSSTNSATMSPQTLTKGYSIKFKATAVPNDNYKFLGWYTDAAGKGTPVYNTESLPSTEGDEWQTYTVNENTVLYAVFQASEDYQKVVDGVNTWLNSATNDVYTISSTEEMYKFAYAVNVLNNSFSGKTVQLTADLDYSNVTLFMPVGTDATKFAGTFDGNGKKITNLTYSGDDKVGIFGYNVGTIKDLTVDSCKFTSKADVGGIAAWSEGIIENCTVNNCTISGGSRYVGGVVGHTYGMTMTEVKSTDNTISGAFKIGGVVGYADGLKATTVTATGNDISSTSTAGLAGALAGHINSGDTTLTDITVTSSALPLIATNYADSGTITISGENTNVETTCIVTDNSNSEKSVTINSGTYTIKSVVEDDTYYTTNVTVSGGTYYSSVTTDEDGTKTSTPLDVTEYVAEGKTQDNTGTVVSGVAEVISADETTTTYLSIGAAISAATAGDTVKLLADVTLTSALTINKSITLDLNEKTIKSAIESGILVVNADNTGDDIDVTIKNGKLDLTNENGLKVLKVQSGKLTLDGVEASGTKYTLDIEGGSVNLVGTTVKATADETVKPYAVYVEDSATFEMDKDSTVTSAYHGVVISASNTKATINGTINAGNFCVATNGTQSNDTIVIGSTANLNSSEGWGMYLPAMDSTATIENGATIIADAAAVEIRAGSLIVNGGTLTATSTTFATYANKSGTSVIGAAIAVSQHTTNDDINVTINGGTLEGYYAVYEEDLMDETDTDKISITITGGSFTATGEVTDSESNTTTTVDAVKSENCTKFISGGTFSSAVPESYCAEGYEPTTTADENNMYTVTVAAPTLTTTLGWDGSDFTIDFLFGGGFKPAEGYTYSVVATMEGADSETVEANFSEYSDGVGFRMGTNTNKLVSAYATVTKGTTDTETAATYEESADTEATILKGAPTDEVAIYSLVVEAIMNRSFEGLIESAQLGKAKEVLNNGGIYLINGESGYYLPDVTDSIMDLTANNDGTYTITLKDKAVNGGILFSEIKSASDDNKTCKVDVAEGGKSVTITISNAVETAEGAVVYLEAVQLDFVPPVEEITSETASEGDDFEVFTDFGDFEEIM